jgi:hypothetical protein
MTKNEQQINIDQQTASPIDTQNSIAFHPDALIPFGPTLTTKGAPSSTYAAGRATLKILSESLTAIRLADDAVRVPHVGGRQELSGPNRAPRWSIDPSLHDGFVKALDQSFGRCSKSLDPNRAAIVASAENLSKEIDAQLSDPARDRASRALESESVRAAVRAAKPEGRLGLVSEWIRDRAFTEVASVLNSPPVSSGFTRAQVDILRPLAEQAFVPDKAAQRDAARAVLSAVDSAAADFVARFKGYTPRTNPTAKNAATARLEALRTGTVKK